MASARTARKRNGWVDLWRLIASLAIMFFHFPIASCPIQSVSGALFVEMFFMLTGYFAFSHIRKADRVGDATFSYMKRFFMHVLPYVALCVIASYVVTMASLLPDISAVIKTSLTIPFDFVLLHCTGLYDSHPSYILWYLSIVMLCLPGILLASHASCRRYGGRMTAYALAVATAMCYGYCIHSLGTLRNNLYGIELFLRAIGGMSAGCAIALATAPDDVGDEATIGDGRISVGWSLVEFLSLASALFLITRPGLNKTPYDTVIVALLFVSFGLSLDGRTVTSRLDLGRMSSYIGDVSLAIYCLHQGVFGILRDLAGVDVGTTRGALVSASVVIVLSVMAAYAIHLMQCLMRDRRDNGRMMPA